jgi:hypothetical protein
MTVEADMRKYLRRRLLTAIRDTLQLAEIAEIDRKEVTSAVITELYYELVRISVACAMNEKDYLKSCQLAYRAMAQHARDSLQE